MAHKLSIAGLGLLVIVAALLVGGEWTLHRRSQEFCNICQRHINPRAGIVAEIGGRRERVCCAHCAVTEGLQEHKPVRLVEVSDYHSGRKLDPAAAWYVDGSRIHACEHDLPRMSEAKRIEERTFDRCAPGTFAFATRGEADAFASANGGAVLSMEALLASVNTPMLSPPKTGGEKGGAPSATEAQP